MAEFFKKPQFLSLKWKLALTLTFLFAIVILLLTQHFSSRYKDSVSTVLNRLRLQNIENLEMSVHHNGEVFFQLLDELIEVDPNNASEAPNENDSNTELALQFVNSAHRQFSRTTEYWGISSSVIINRDKDVLFQVGKQEDIEFIATLNADRNIDQMASVSLHCYNDCMQVIVKQLYLNNQKVGALILTRPLEHLAQQFFNRSGTHLGIIALQGPPESSSSNTNTNSSSNRTNPQQYTNNSQPLTNATYYLPNWQSTLLTPWPEPELIASLHEASRVVPFGQLSGTYHNLRNGNKHYAVSSMPVRGNSNSNLRYILLADITSDYQAILSNIMQEVAIIASLITLFVAYITYISWRHLSRINQQLRVLPMLGQKQFHEVRSMIGQNKRFRIYQDEFDDLDNSVTALTYQLESLEKAVNVRTREMERLSLFDTLTGLANRNLFLYELQRDVQRFQQQGGMLAIVILDLDKFKRINDTLAHQLGDILLGKIGSRLRTATRNLGLVARLGGDEFALILRSAKKYAQVEVLCQKILDLIHKPIELDNHTVVISCSLGISLAGASQSANDLIKNAEIAMYKAKESGGNTYRVFNAVMATEAHANLSLETEIRRAFENKEFTLYLQPKVNMDSQIEGFESLIRWDHPDRGILPPSEFIPAMENMGLISRLDNFVLDASCRQLKVLQTHYPHISIAVNISSTHFTDKNFLVFLKDCLNAYPISPNRLELEITETLLMENMNVGMEIIQQIKDLGVSIAIDDFGTGYSSLSYLKKLPVDTIKIDREFIKDIPDSESDMQISSVIIFLAKQLNFKVVAEGVETSEQLVFLKANQCDLAQGFYFSKPIPAHKSMIMLESQRRDKKASLG